MLTAVLSNFGLAASLSAVVVLSTLAAVFVALRRNRSPGAPLTKRLARVLAVGSALLILSATAVPYGWPPERYGFGDLILAPGRGGLGEIGELLADPTSLAAVVLAANIGLYAWFAFWASLAWPGQRPLVLLMSLALSACVELVQFVALERVAATDDVLLNLLGAFVGLGIALGIDRLRGGGSELSRS